MKKLIAIFLIAYISLNFNSCDTNEDDDVSIETRTEWECGSHNGNTLFTGPQGGCYYYNSNGNKTYVDRSECNC